jgi:D-3-phosphoglycerate dehydrogenase
MDILITEDLQSPAIDRLAGQFTVVREPTLWNDPARLLEQVREARTLLIRNQTLVTSKVIAAAPNLIAIGRHGVGLDNIDMEAATRSGIVVIAPLDANAVSVAELAMGLILALARKIPMADRATKAGGWDRRGHTGIELAQKTIGICGFGRIGRQVASRARAFGMRVLVFDPFVQTGSPVLQESSAELCRELAMLLTQSDFITTHSPLTPETRKMFNERAFAAVKPGAYFINTSRGGVVDEAALAAALKSGRLGGAALDVREVEPPTERIGFESMDNVILLPHIGSGTVEAQARTIEAVTADLERALRGQPAQNAVNRPASR